MADKRCPSCDQRLTGPEYACGACQPTADEVADLGVSATAALNVQTDFQVSCGGHQFGVPALLDGTYQLESMLGRGGMGVVFRAQDVRLRRHVAIKVVPLDGSPSPHAAQRFEREAQSLAALDHPNVVQVYSFGHGDGFDYFVMGFIDGPHLGRLLRRRVRSGEGPFAPEEALALLAPVASALDHAHARGLVHRDVKPQNIIVQAGGRPVLVDFGVARSDGDRVRLTRTGAILGTPVYMAPEQAMGRTVTASSDIYSLGIVLYELLTATTPFEASTALAVLCRVHTEELPPLEMAERREVGARLDVVLRRATAKDPAERFATASEFIEAAQALCSPASGGRLAEAHTADGSAPAQAGVPTPQPSLPDADPSPPPDWALTTPMPAVQPGRPTVARWVWAVGAVGALLVLLVGGWLLARAIGLWGPPVGGVSLPSAAVQIPRRAGVGGDGGVGLDTPSAPRPAGPDAGNVASDTPDAAGTRGAPSARPRARPRTHPPAQRRGISL